MKKVPFDGRSAEMKKDSPWLASEDIDGLGDVKVTVENVFKNDDVIMDGGRKENNIYSLKFKGTDKEMILNSINRQRMVKMYGPKVADWKGKQIELYVDDKVKLKGSIVKGLRIKEKQKSV